MRSGRVFKRGFFTSVLFGIGSVVFTLIIIIMVILGIQQAEESGEAAGIRLLEEAITRAVIHSYAVNGKFPQSLSYITENYGIFIDSARFVVHYEVFAANILPDIQVFGLRR